MQAKSEGCILSKFIFETGKEIEILSPRKQKPAWSKCYYIFPSPSSRGKPSSHKFRKQKQRNCMFSPLLVAFHNSTGFLLPDETAALFFLPHFWKGPTKAASLSLWHHQGLISKRERLKPIFSENWWKQIKKNRDFTNTRSERSEFCIIMDSHFNFLMEETDSKTLIFDTFTVTAPWKCNLTRLLVSPEVNFYIGAVFFCRDVRHATHGRCQWWSTETLNQRKHNHQLTTCSYVTLRLFETKCKGNVSSLRVACVFW